MIDPAPPAHRADAPVTQARPGPATASAILAIAACAPLALLLLPNRIGNGVTVVVAQLGITPGQLGHALLVAVLAAALVGPVAAWSARALPPWVVLVAGVLAAAVSYWVARKVGSLAGLDLVRGLQGGAAGALLGGTAALVGAAPLRTRPYLAATWAAAVVGASAAAMRAGMPAPLDLADRGDQWRDRLQPYPWLVALAGLTALALAAASMADRRPRLFPRWIDLAALLPLLAAVPTAAVVWGTHGPGHLVAYHLGMLAGVLAVIGAVALVLAARRPWTGRALVGAVTAAVSYATVPAVGAVAGLLISVRLRAAAVGVLDGGPVGGASVGGIVGAAAVAGVLGAAASAVLPEARRRVAILAGLAGAAVGAATLLPVSTQDAATLPGIVLLAGGCGVAVGAVLRSVGPLATAVAGGLAAVAITAGQLAIGALVVWRLEGAAAGATVGPDAVRAQQHALYVGTVQATRWWLAVLIVMFLVAVGVVMAVLPREPGGAA